ncbi:hypothetical protein [Polyangium aurulentum]|uniref:hypothetical protein n=1 Tax=Polyangium aurulentum TaxID=2567896 RepID=UPI0010AECF82|nr:hypothetical protein [Polyangium aurulentum]UQA62272.1 hypothetical protein E8A73_018085 [Polyangium aurulentum]
MSGRVSFSANRPTGARLRLWYEAVRAALDELEMKIRRAIVNGETVPERFLGKTEDEVRAVVDEERSELGHAASLMVLAAAEAALRVDYLGRVYEKRKDPLSRGFRELYKTSEQKRGRGTRVRLEEDLLEKWVERQPQAKAAVDDFRKVLKYRHWLAHGRYWVPKFSHDYDVQGVLDVVDEMMKQLAIKP